MTTGTFLRRLAVNVLAAVALAGCTSDPPDQPDQRDDPPPPSSAGPLADRDRTAVVAALRELDTCELLLAASAGLITPPPGAEPIFRFPANCLLASNSSNLASVSIQIHELWPQPIAYDSSEQRRALGGATAFIDGGLPTQCHVYLPVSPTTALDVKADDLNATQSPCALAESLATAVAETLDDPGRFRAAPRWGPCDALMAAHSGRSDRYDESVPSAACTDKSSGATLSFHARKPGISGTEAVGATPWRPEPVAGAEVWFSDNPAKGFCDAQWAAGQLDSPYSSDSSGILLAQVTATSCADARTVLEPLVGVLQQPPPVVAPQRPLLYPV